MGLFLAFLGHRLALATVIGPFARLGFGLGGVSRLLAPTDLWANTVEWSGLNKAKKSKAWAGIFIGLLPGLCLGSRPLVHTDVCANTGGQWFDLC